MTGNRAAEIRVKILMVIVTMFAFLSALLVNELLFIRYEFIPGVNWVFLPAGIRVLALLMFGAAGAIGLLLVSLLICFFYFFPGDVGRALAGGLVAAAAPCMAHRIFRYFYGPGPTFGTMSFAQLAVCALLFSVLSPLLHHVWFVLRGDVATLQTLLVMIAGDLAGTIILLALARLGISLWRRGVHTD
jgi:hypothetical protein